LSAKEDALVVRLSALFVTLPDGRKLGYCTVGKGPPVVYFHGTASSRLEVLLLKEFAEKSGLQIVGVDRPGYGLSTFHTRRSLQDFNSDVNFLADTLGFERFAVLGWSGGGAFAVAYLSQYPERVTKALVADSPSLPFNVSNAHDFPFSKYVMKLHFVGVLAMRQFRRSVLKAGGDPSAFLATKQAKQMLRGYTETDLQFFSNPAWAKLMFQSMAEAFRQECGVNAVVDEHMFFLKPWGFSFSNIPAGKLVIWQGEDDKTCNVSNAYALARLVSGSELNVFEGRGHCALFENLNKLAEVLSLKRAVVSGF
jgi:pimeloyl-ACP methyl ester carboxylesterase